MSDPRTDLLIERYIHGLLSEAERSEIEQSLLADPAARTLFWQRARMHGLLARWGQETWGQRRASDPLATEGADKIIIKANTISPPWLRSWSDWWWPAAALAAAWVLVVLLVNQTAHDQRKNVTTTELMGVAVLRSAAGAVWDERSPAVGEVLKPGVLHLTQGAVQIDFYSGARLVIEAPARFKLVSDMAATCELGRVHAYVPTPARGFTITAPDLTVVDLGTEFGLRVNPSGMSDVHVFTGEVTVAKNNSTEIPTAVTSGQAVQLADQEIKLIPVSDSRTFLNEAALIQRVEAESSVVQARWRQSATQVSKDPTTVVHFTFENEQRGKQLLTNYAADSNEKTSASIIGCAWGDGRWPGKGALAFQRPGDRVRLDIPETFSALSLLAWIRMDVMPAPQSSLLASVNVLPGAVRWSVTDKGGLRLAISKTAVVGDSNWEAINSPPMITDVHLGTWIMLASTYDGKMIHHYLNGELFHTGAARVPFPMLFGITELGNWRHDEAAHIQAHMDQFMLMSRALSPVDLRSIYDAGRP